MNESSYCYKACQNCEIALPQDPFPTPFVCNSLRCAGRQSNYKRVFRLVFKIRVDKRIIEVVCFDRDVEATFGCSAQEYYHFDHLRPYAVKSAGRALMRERFKLL